ncbi:DUF6090 family protein [Psychroserpens sp. XS_ASV72]|uniref:DUF6090 family protein n=1 Tax=Psychroserpens sp. XS_ASV72 TaxID=3241293 RepID=UPI0035138707
MKFFRKIRQSLLSENKFRKYLIYAIGEIVLVVIGILIALSINNWNENQKDLETEGLILKQLQNEYQSNLLQLDEKILMRNEALVACNKLLNFIDDPNSVDEDLFYNSFSKIIRDPTFDPIKNDIVGTDKLRLIRNQELVRILSNWSSEVYQVQEIELEYQKFRTEMIIPCAIRLGVSRNINNNVWKDGYTPTEALDKNYNYKFSIGQSKKNVDLNNVLSDTELEGIVSQVITFSQIANFQSQTLRDRITNMLSILEQEIQKHQ